MLLYYNKTNIPSSLSRLGNDSYFESYWRCLSENPPETMTTAKVGVTVPGGIKSESLGEVFPWGVLSPIFGKRNGLIMIL